MTDPITKWKERSGQISKWDADCLANYGRVLIGDGAHYCTEWDFLPIDETCKEYEACICWK